MSRNIDEHAVGQVLVHTWGLVTCSKLGQTRIKSEAFTVRKTNHEKNLLTVYKHASLLILIHVNKKNDINTTQNFLNPIHITYI